MNQSIQVLIIEDTPDHAELIRMSVCRIDGCRVTVADRIGQAVQLLEKNSYNAIISDLNLPDSDRDLTVQTIKAAAPHTPLLILTGDAQSSTGDYCIAAGAQDYIRKDALSTTPVDRILFNAIERQRILNENIALAEELHTKNMELEIAMNKAAAAVKAKANFLANMSHEIRTPLTSILGFTDIASDTDGVMNDPEASDALGMIKKNCSHLLEVVNDILDVSKVEAGALKLQYEPLSLTEVVGDVVNLCTPQATVKEISISLEHSPAVPESMMLDPMRIKQVLINLIGNAIKFTEQGSINVSIDSTEVKDGEHWVSVAIQDTGIGMDDDELRVIRKYQAFTQANMATTRTYGGSGLGLRISQGLAVLMGGSIEIESENQQGSRFTFNFKASESDSNVDCSSKKIVMHQSDQLSGLRVLIADDSEDNQKLFAHYLGRCGAITECVSDGKGCLNRLKDSSLESVDLVLMDIQMPIMDGLTAFSMLRMRGHDFPVYATSASSTVDDQRLVIEAGFDGFIAKPIDSDQLVAIATGIQRAKHHRAA